MKTSIEFSCMLHLCGWIFSVMFAFRSFTWRLLRGLCNTLQVFRCRKYLAVIPQRLGIKQNDFDMIIQLIADGWHFQHINVLKDRLSIKHNFYMNFSCFYSLMVNLPCSFVVFRITVVSQINGSAVKDSIHLKCLSNLICCCHSW